MNIRKATAEDFNDIDPILVEVELHHVNLEPDVFQPITHYDEEQYLGYIQDPESCVWVAVEDEKFVGAIIAQVHQRAYNQIYVAKRFVVVEEVCVSKSYRRTGVGKDLIRVVEDWAEEQGIQEVQLSVWEKNSEAIQFYETLGYEMFLIRMRKKMGQE